MTQVVVTGGLGYVGSAVVDAIAGRMSGADSLVVIDRPGAASYLPQAPLRRLVTVLEADLSADSLPPLAAGALRQADLVIHLAAGTATRVSPPVARQDYCASLRMTGNVLTAMPQERPTSLVYFSSSAVYGSAAARPAFESSGPLLPVSLYGAQKLACEGMISAHVAQTRIRAVIIRPGTIIDGYMRKGVIAAIVGQLRETGRATVLGDGCQARTFILRNEMAQAAVHLAGFATSPPSVYNVSSAGLVSVRRIAAAACRQAGLAESVVSYGTTETGWPGDVAVVNLSLRRLRATGWRATATSCQAVTQTIRDMLAG